MAKDYITTTEASKLLSVAPDTVLKWVRAGKIKSYRTPGGHSRIPLQSVTSLLSEQKNETTLQGTSVEKDHQYCWEYLSDDSEILDECKECLTYKSRASRCYELKKLSDDLVCFRIGCETTCENCDYYKLVHGKILSILILSENKKIVSDHSHFDVTKDLQVKFVGDEYECSYTIENYRPDYIIVDDSVGMKRVQSFCTNLFNDPRIPVARIVLASKSEIKQEYCHKDIFGWIQKPFTIRQLKHYIRGVTL